MSENVEKTDNLTVSHLYNTLKSPNFLQKLYWEILSNIKEKDTYKLMRGMAESLINQNMNVLNDLNNNEADNAHKKKIVAEVCVMSYAIDTIFSKLLYVKLENACKAQILSIITQLRDEGKISESVWAKFMIKTEPPETEISAQNSVVEANAHKKKVPQNIPKRVGRRKRKVNSKFLQDIKRAISNKDILEDLKKVNGTMETDKSSTMKNEKVENLPKTNAKGQNKELPKKTAASPEASTSTKRMAKENVSKSVNKISEDTTTVIPKDSLQIDNLGNDSDAESEISVGGISFGSVSSVHTSDLSSFDDEISLSSDDEDGKKRRVSLKQIQKKLSESSNSSITSEVDNKSPKSSKFKETPQPDKGTIEENKKKNQVSLNKAAKKEPESGSTAEPLMESGLSKRARKPNSKYSSDNIICTIVKVKDRKKAHSDTDHLNGKSSSDEHSPQKKKLKIDSDIIGDLATITKSMNNEGSTSTSDTKTPIRSKAQDVSKSHSANRSLTSRKTAPVTLFST